MTAEEAREKITEKGLKVTPQRVAIWESIYKALDALIENKVIKKVTTEADKMRYYGIIL
jgi:Fe2+ or Zn2+ uptake regulation protein